MDKMNNTTISFLFFVLVPILAIIILVSNSKLALKSGSTRLLTSLTTDSYFDSLTDTPSVLDPFSFTYTAPADGTILVHATCFAWGDAGHPTSWTLLLDDNGSTSHDVQAQTHVDNILMIPISLLISIPVLRNVEHVFSLQGSQTGSEGDEGLQNMSWTVSFVQT